MTGEPETVPCALKDYLSKGGSRYSFADLTPQECQIAFQYWVAYARKDLPDTLATQRAVCPLLYCGKVFDSLESYLHHVSVCPWLSNGWYRCPNCRRREKFVPPVSKDGEILQRSVCKKETKLKRAVTFFKQFGGCSSFSRQNSSSFSKPGKNNPLHRWQVNRRVRDRSELDTHPRKTQPPELDTMDYSFDSIKHHDGADHKLEICGIVNTSQLDVSVCTILPGPKYSRQSATPAELSGSDPPCYELLSSEPQRPELSAGGSSGVLSDVLMGLDEPVAYDLISPMSPTLTIRESTFTPFSDLVSPISPVDSSVLSDLVSPISPIEGGFLSDLLSPISPIESPSIQWSMEGQLRRPVLSVVTNAELLNTRQPSGNADQHGEGPRQPCKLYSNGAVQPHGSKSANEHGKGLPSKNELPSSQTLIKDVRDLVYNLHHYWLEKLSSIPELPVSKAWLQAKSPIEVGLEAVQCCFRGVLLKTFEDIFSLTEFAFACAYIIYEDDDAFWWDDFYRNILEWRHAITDEDDQRLFLKVAFLIWSPPQMPEIVRQGAAHSIRPLLSSCSASIRNDFDSGKNALLFEADASRSPLQQVNPPSPLLAKFRREREILDTLRSGKVITVCSRYLDALEYTGIANRDENRSLHPPLQSERSLAHIRMIETHIIVPLAKAPAIKVFCDAVMITTIDLCDGVLRNVREVEVSLALNGSRCDQPRQAYEEFLTLVASLCDNAMSQPDPSWRDRYYAAILDEVQATCLELEGPRRRMLPPVEEVFPTTTILGQEYSYLQTPTSVTPLGDPSPTSSTSATSLSSFSNGTWGSTGDPCTQPSSLDNSPTEILPGPNKSFSTPSVPPVPTLHCSTCGQAFKGVYRMTNLRRHMRNTHLRRVKLICPELGCDVECSRTDNLRKHRRVVHGIVDRAIRHGSQKRHRRKTW